ncbi:type II toxin-antitoxin system RelE/ParE family toxin [Asticcacaulis sp. BYS171W]|uniref:Type II toxin-antitoxin system RelE/ParE family toxin n=1 Tax=Asticcacaulis aquaticus TaxID=2984212 RepID=A0ABT5HQK8_9CAUL|nr:type II toxin-antitoxin system RelE/ParE family toxin [Asticcacaulis aquaticus]MDC7682360.1 type II toxin-antitoxin system RelE/ParE family toxin [Asticcacaulis aquaticus]
MMVFITRQALADLEDVADFIAQDSPVQAVRFALELKSFCLGLGDRPRGYAQIEGLGEFRRAPYGNYSIFYRLAGVELRVSRILHSARLVNADMLTG